MPEDFLRTWWDLVEKITGLGPLQVQPRSEGTPAGSVQKFRGSDRSEQSVEGK